MRVAIMGMVDRMLRFCIIRHGHSPVFVTLLHLCPDRMAERRRCFLLQLPHPLTRQNSQTRSLARAPALPSN